MIIQDRETIEKIAIEEYGAFKINDDSFVFTTNTASTRCIRKCYKKSRFYNDLMLVRQIKEFNVPKSGQIAINCCDILDDGSKILEVICSGIKNNSYNIKDRVNIDIELSKII